MGAVIRWGACDCAFELETAEPDVGAHARTVFGPWVVPARTPPRRRWHARRARAGYALANGGTAPPTHFTGVRELVQAVEYEASATLAQGAGPRVAFHGALVTRAGIAVLILGAPETGKSTLALALWQRGWTLKSDDLALVEGDTALAWPGPRRVSVRHASRPLLGESLWRAIESCPSACAGAKGLLFHPDDVLPRPDRAPPSRLAAILLLGRAAPDAPLTPVVPAHALLVLPVYTQQSIELGLGLSLERMRALASNVPVYTQGRAALGAQVAQIDALFP